MIASKLNENKNCDIQILRTLAIAAILGFHLRPNYVPQGYLGVDIFFVISGYLMTSILDGKVLVFKTILQFYERRLKRLLPVYLLDILLTIFATSFFLITTDYDFLKMDAIWTMSFATNFQSIFEKETYFKFLSEYKFLLHTWSLSLEIQYYFLAPFLLIPISSNKNPLIPTIIIFISSFLFQTFIPFPTLSFGLIFSRIWQFFMGTIVFYYQKNKNTKVYSQLPEEASLVLEANEIENNEQITKTFRENASFNPNLFIFIALIGICFMPQLSEHYFYIAGIRLFSIILSGLAIFYGYGSTPAGKFAVFKKIGIYIGDISYSFYLLHWPIIILFKYQGWFDTIELWQMLTCIVFLSIIQYHLFEKVLLQKTSTVVFSVVILFYMLVIMLLFQLQGLDLVLFEDQAVLGNERIAQECNELLMENDCNWDPILIEVSPKPTKTEAYFCSYEGSGNATIFFTGNSFALRQLHGVKKALNKIYKKLYFVSRPACMTFEVLNKNQLPYWQCDEVMNKTVKFLEKIKPDIMIITQKINSGTFLQSVEAARNDAKTKIMAKYFKIWSPYVNKKIFHIEPHPTLKINLALTLAKEIAQGKDISSHFLSSNSVSKQIDPGWFRIKAAMLDCPKCEPIEMRDAFMEDGKFYTFDKKTKLSLFCDNSHFSFVGAEKMVPNLKKIVSKALKDL